MTVLLYKLACLLLPVVDGGRSTNTIFYAQVKAGHRYYHAVKFQEKIEAAYKRLLVIAFAAPALLAAWHFTREPLAVVILGLFTPLISIIPPIRRGVEYRGQSVETYLRWKLYGETIDYAERKNAEQLTGYNQFSGWTADEIEIELRKWRGWAERMCRGFDQ